MFIDQAEEMPVVIFYKKTGRTYTAMSEKDFNSNKKLTSEEKEKYHKLSLRMKVITWELQNKILEKSHIVNPEDPNRYIWSVKASKEAKLLNLIISWDAKDKDGNPIAATPERILSLAPDIAETILNTHDEQSYLGDDEVGK